MNGCVRELSAEPNCGRMLIIYVDSKWRNVSIALGGKSIFCCCILLKDIKRINHVYVFYSVTMWIIASFLWVLIVRINSSALWSFFLFGVHLSPKEVAIRLNKQNSEYLYSPLYHNSWTIIDLQLSDLYQ